MDRLSLTMRVISLVEKHYVVDMLIASSHFQMYKWEGLSKLDFRRAYGK